MYTFLLASLPQLQLGEVPPLTLDELNDAVSAAMIPADDCRKLNSFDGAVALDEAGGACYPRVYREYWQFENFLRRRIARKRADRNGAALDLPLSDYFDAETALRVDQAAAMAPLEREKALDALRWHKIDEIVQSDHFDFDALCAYRLQLILLWAHSRRDTARGREAFGALLDEKAAMA